MKIIRFNLKNEGYENKKFRGFRLAEIWLSGLFNGFKRLESTMVLWRA